MRLAIFAVLTSLTAVATEIPKGAHVLLKMMNSINTRTAQEGPAGKLLLSEVIHVGSLLILNS